MEVAEYANSNLYEFEQWPEYIRNHYEAKLIALYESGNRLSELQRRADEFNRRHGGI